ncbi:FIST signal transduction protein [Flavobacterium sp.]|uniref:FIST signal transduction protein n=1 Tax=Flavobacterium sp. TaxID=239 RepID=UPI00374D5A82
MKAKSIISRSTTSLESNLLNLLKDGYRPTLGIVFCSSKQDFKEISSIFDNCGIDLLGCTTAGEITDDTLTENSISCLLMDISKDKYRLHFVRNTEGVLETGSTLRQFAQEAFTNPAMIVCSAGVLNDGEKVVEGLRQGTQREIPLFGGLAGDDLQILNTHIFTRKEYTNDGMAAIVFDNDKVEIKGLATSGWEALGSENTVTHAQGNTIYTINNEPALDFFVRFFGAKEDMDMKGKPLSTVSAQYPLQVMRDTDYAVLRSPIYGDENNRSLTLVGSIKEGDKFRFSISPGIEVIEKTVAEFQSFKNEIPDVDALILFSCKGRHAALGPFIEDEIKGIYEQWNKPMIGFLSYGEIGNLGNGVCEFHNGTCCLVTIKERN